MSAIRLTTQSGKKQKGAKETVYIHCGCGKVFKQASKEHNRHVGHSIKGRHSVTY